VAVLVAEAVAEKIGDGVNKPLAVSVTPAETRSDSGRVAKTATAELAVDSLVWLGVGGLVRLATGTAGVAAPKTGVVGTGRVSAPSPPFSATINPAVAANVGSAPCGRLYNEQPHNSRTNTARYSPIRQSLENRIREFYLTHDRHESMMQAHYLYLVGYLRKRLLR
jgi:hypothetical protein